VTTTKEVVEMDFVDEDEGEGRWNEMPFEEGGVGSPVLFRNQP